MNDMAETNLILHVKGTEHATTSLPRQVVRAAISQGQITHSQLIWSAEDNAWKQVRELPQLWPSQKLAPPPPTRLGTGALPKVAATRGQTGPVPRVVARAATPAGSGVSQPLTQGSPPKPTGGTAVAVPAKRPTGEDLVVKEEHGPNPLKWICIGLAVVIFITVGINYLLVDLPLVSRLRGTNYSHVPVYAHLGAFMQPNMIVIHLPSSSSLTEANLTDFLVALAASTPEAPLSGNTFDRVALTSGWTGRYSFSGYAWKQLGSMAQEEESQRKEFLLDQMGNAAGEPLTSDNSNLSDDARQAERDKIWADFVAQFVPASGHR
jgi:hypothetical protein